jgi:hypothetical protein
MCLLGRFRAEHRATRHAHQLYRNIPMKLYAVRTIADKHPVGFFVVFDFRGLLVAVDAYVDADECEYKPIRGECGIVWEQPVDWQLGIDLQLEAPDAEAAFDEQVRRGLAFYGAIDRFIGVETIQRWRPLIGPVQEN